MMTPVTNIDDPESRPVPRFALFELGFRAFFLFAGITALLLVPIWVYAYVRGYLEFGYYSALTWHSHEMIFGYAAAVIAGFLLTAVRNWTNIQTPRGVALASLVALWLAGRVVPFFSGVMPHWSIAVVDMAFLPVLAVTLSVPLLRSRQKHNLVFLFVLAALTVANIMVHLQILGITEATAKHGIYFAVYLIVLLIAILGGRVIPFFTEKGIVGARIRRWATVEYVSLGSLGVLTVLDLVDAAPPAVIVFAILTALGHGIRLFGWYQRTVWSVPLLWVLHLGYAWLVAGFILKALSAAELINPMLAIHAFTAGGIGTITLGMMARVALGHTGRVLRAGPAMTWSFVLANLAGVSRVFLSLLSPGRYSEWIVLAGVLWSVAFAIFVITYSGILIQPRLDGRPG
ncbi:MAG: NnrS family protein [Gammaproteobacteria bacterium]